MLLVGGTTNAVDGGTSNAVSGVQQILLVGGYNKCC